MILFVGKLVKIFPNKVGHVGFGLIIVVILAEAIRNGYWRIPSKTKHLINDEEGNGEEALGRE